MELFRNKALTETITGKYVIDNFTKIKILF